MKIQTRQKKNELELVKCSLLGHGMGGGGGGGGEGGGGGGGRQRELVRD